jgi:hypothetical protein
MLGDISLAEALTLFGSVAGGVLAALALAAGARSLFRRTIGRPRDLEGRLRQLGTGAQLDFFEGIIGNPPAIRRTFHVDRPNFRAESEKGSPQPLVRHSYRECFFVDRLCFVQTVSDDDGAVVAFSITTRSKSFHPTLTFPNVRLPSRWSQALGASRYRGPTRKDRLRAGLRTLFRPPKPGKHVKLGRTTFAETGGPGRIQSMHANKHWSYVESHWGGNPGYYQSVLYAATRGSPVARCPDGIQNFDSGNRRLSEDAPVWIEKARSTCVITTMAVLRMGFDVDDSPVIGPTVDQMRTLP